MALIIGIYLLLGLIATIIVIVKEPLILYAWLLLPIVVLVWPYALWVVFTSDNTGRWI
jgi:hypothetical protein